MTGEVHCHNLRGAINKHKIPGLIVHTTTHLVSRNDQIFIPQNDCDCYIKCVLVPLTIHIISMEESYSHRIELEYVI